MRGNALRLGLSALVLSVVLVLASAVLFSRGSSPTPSPQGRGGAASAAEILTAGNLSGTITALQTRLKRLPTDADSWAFLGSAYVQQARVTGDPTYYPKAEGVLRRSFEEKPKGNSAALTAQASLAAGRHKFGKSLDYARAAMRINSYNIGTMAVLVDSLVELGRYDEAFRALQRMVNIKPGVPSYTRVSYSYELRGDTEGARFGMQQALKTAFSVDDKAFALFQLGELEWNQGNLNDARSLYQQGLEASPSYVPNLYGLAKTASAAGNTDVAVDTWQQVIDRLPQSQYVIEYTDYLTSLGRDDEAAQQQELIDAQEQILRASGVNLDLELALYDASHGRERQALVEARKAYGERKSVFVEDAYAWALHVNGRDREALTHAVKAQQLGTKSALFAFHRGMIEESLGMTQAARRSLRQALDINPYFSPVFAPEAKRKLDQLQAR